jgi:hypothetical protein
MPSLNKGFLAASVLVFLLGAGLYLGDRPSVLGPPALIERPRRQTLTVAQDSPTMSATLSDPWFRMPIVAVSPPPKPVAAPVHVDTTSLTFLGSSTDQDGTPSYFFKFAPTGQVVILKAGETKKGWTLASVVDRSFILSGTGGQFEATR